MNTVPDCYSCRQESLGNEAPLRQRIVRTAHWRVAHAFNSALEGWLVVLPRRHITSVDQLSDEESAELGTLVRNVAVALRDELGERCVKTYVMQFSEAEGFHHLHFHVVPRAHDLAEEHRGPRIMHFLQQPEEDWVSQERQEKLSDALSARCQRRTGTM